MAYEKMHNIFDLAIRMQSSAEGISITDVMQQFDVSRRTAERMRNFIRERFPQLTETIGEHGVKRWHLPYGALKNYISFSAEEISTLQNALRLLKHVQLCEQSRTLAGLLTKLKAMMRPEVCCRIETDTEIMQASEGYLFRPVQKIEINPRHLALLRHAVTACRKIRLCWAETNTLRKWQTLPDTCLGCAPPWHAPGRRPAHTTERPGHSPVLPLFRYKSRCPRRIGHRHCPDGPLF